MTMAELTLDATNLIVGRMASYLAKQALLGHAINVLNCEHAVMSGNPASIREKYYLRRRETGQPQTGPFVPKVPDRFVRRIIRGMLPHKQPRGKEAYGRVMCYIGVPEKFKTAKLITVSWAHADKLTTTKMQTIGELCKWLGWKQ